MRGFDTTLSLQMHIKTDIILESRREKGPGSETLKERVLTSFLSCMRVRRGGGDPGDQATVPSALNCLQCPARAKIDKVRCVPG